MKKFFLGDTLATIARLTLVALFVLFLALLPYTLWKEGDCQEQCENQSLVLFSSSKRGFRCVDMAHVILLEDE